MDQILKQVAEVDKTLNNNFVPSFALGMSLFGGLSSTDFWGIIQTDLQEKNISVNTANFEINVNNNLLLKESNSLLYSINTQLGQLNDIIARKANNEERENFAREIIYNINKMSNSLDSNKDNSYIAYEAKSLLSIIENNNITTATFTQISDKEYFEKIVEKLKIKSTVLSDSEKNDLDGFTAIYSLAVSLLEEAQKKRIIKVHNIQNDFVIPEKPVKDEILDCEEEIEHEVESDSFNLVFYSPHLRKYIQTTEELPDFFEKFFQIKKEYTLNFWKYNWFLSIQNLIEKRETFVELESKINCCIMLIDKYLEDHPDLLRDFPKLSLAEVIDSYDSKRLNDKYQEALKREESLLQKYYCNMLEKIQRQQDRLANLKKGGLFSFFRKNR